MSATLAKLYQIQMLDDFVATLAPSTVKIFLCKNDVFGPAVTSLWEDIVEVENADWYAREAPTYNETADAGGNAVKVVISGAAYNYDGIGAAEIVTGVGLVDEAGPTLICAEAL